MNSTDQPNSYNPAYTTKSEKETPLASDTNVAIGMETLDGVIYSDQQMKNYERFTASGGNACQLVTVQGDSAMGGSTPSFNIFSLG